MFKLIAASTICIVLSCATQAQDKTAKPELRCKLTTEELQQRKATVLARLKREVLERREMETGFAYRFPGTDRLLDELTEFIKTERECCDFLTFNVRASGDKTNVWLELTGPEGAKEVVQSELDL